MLIVTVASTVQTAVGFGFGLMSVPLLLWVGLPLPVAIALAIAAGSVQSAYGAYVARESIDFREAFRLAGFQVLGMPLGLCLLHFFVAEGPAFAKQVVGASLLVVLTTRLAVRPTPRDSVPSWVGAIASATSGLLSAALGIGGPPLVLFALAHRWDVARTRGFLWTQFVLGTAPLVIILGARFGTSVLVGFAAGLVLAPALYVGSRIGFALTRRWREATLARAATAMLYLLALLSLGGPWLGMR